MSDNRTTEWRFTSEGEPAFYANNPETRAHGLANREMPGYRPGTVVGNVLERDLWDILTTTKLWLVEINKPYEDYGPEVWDDYLWKVEADTNWLYSDPDRDGVMYLDQRVVSGAFGVTDELNWMGFCACFNSDDLQALTIEVDTEWRVIYQAPSDYNEA